MRGRPVRNLRKEARRFAPHMVVGDDARAKWTALSQLWAPRGIAWHTGVVVNVNNKAAQNQHRAAQKIVWHMAAVAAGPTNETGRVQVGRTRDVKVGTAGSARMLIAFRLNPKPALSLRVVQCS